MTDLTQSTPGHIQVMGGTWGTVRKSLFDAVSNRLIERMKVLPQGEICTAEALLGVMFWAGRVEKTADQGRYLHLLHREQRNPPLTPPTHRGTNVTVLPIAVAIQPMAAPEQSGLPPCLDHVYRRKSYARSEAHHRIRRQPARLP